MAHFFKKNYDLALILDLQIIVLTLSSLYCSRSGQETLHSRPSSDQPDREGGNVEGFGIQRRRVHQQRQDL